MFYARSESVAALSHVEGRRQGRPLSYSRQIKIKLNRVHDVPKTASVGERFSCWSAMLRFQFRFLGWEIFDKIFALLTLISLEFGCNL